jgi:hypothetical protein
MLRKCTIRSDEQLLPDTLIPEPDDDENPDEIGPARVPIAIMAKQRSTLVLNQENIRRWHQQANAVVSNMETKGGQ